MALIEYTAAVDHISGKIRGTVFSNNKGGNYVRGRGVVANPKSDSQSLVRSIFGSISAQWRSLTQNQISDWNKAGPSFPYINRLGNEQNLSGKSLFQQLNLNLKQLGAGLIKVPPVPAGAVGVSAITSLSADTGSEKIKIKLELPAAAGDTDYILEATPALSPGLNNANNRFRQVATTGNSGIGANSTIDETDFATDAAALWTTITDKVGAPQEGAKLFVRVRPVNSVTGETTASIQKSTIGSQ